MARRGEKAVILVTAVMAGIVIGVFISAATAADVDSIGQPRNMGAAMTDVIVAARN